MEAETHWGAKTPISSLLRYCDVVFTLGAIERVLLHFTTFVHHTVCCCIYSIFMDACSCESHHKSLRHLQWQVILLIHLNAMHRLTPIVFYTVLLGTVTSVTPHFFPSPACAATSAGGDCCGCHQVGDDV